MYKIAYHYSPQVLSKDRIAFRDQPPAAGLSTPEHTASDALELLKLGVVRDVKHQATQRALCLLRIVRDALRRDVDGDIVEAGECSHQIRLSAC